MKDTQLKVVEEVAGKAPIEVDEIIVQLNSRIDELGKIKLQYINKIDQLKQELKNSEITLHVIDGLIGEHTGNLSKWK